MKIIMDKYMITALYNPGIHSGRKSFEKLLSLMRLKQSTYRG